MPQVSIIIPSFNQSQYLEFTICSILEQDFTDYEIILMDGGSVDESLNIIEKYARYLTYWQSQPDGGQTKAISLGIEISRGRLITWLNSDDILLPGALRLQARAWNHFPDADVYYGNHIHIDSRGMIVERFKHPRFYPKLAWNTAPYFAQPGTVFTRRIWERVGGVDTEMHCAFDYDLWYRFMQAGAYFIHVGGFVSGFRRHSESKGSKWLEKYAQEHNTIRSRYAHMMGNRFTRLIARVGLISLQSISGNYLYSLAYRLLNHGRLSAYMPPNLESNADLR